MQRTDPGTNHLGLWALGTLIAAIVLPLLLLGLGAATKGNIHEELAIVAVILAAALTILTVVLGIAGRKETAGKVAIISVCVLGIVEVLLVILIFVRIMQARDEMKAWETSMAADASTMQSRIAGQEDKTPGQPKEVTNSIGMKLALIPVGKFVMGSPKEEEDHGQDEEQHEMSITKSFYLGVYVVTQAEYEKVMGKNLSWFSPKGGGKDRVKDMDTGQFPVEMVSWDDAVAFCKKLSELPEEKKAGRVYRLPTEAEWEYACRAGTKTAFHYGNSLSSKQANFDGNRPYGGADKGPYLERTTKVGSNAANAFGLYDMHGNVWECCQDWYDEDYYKNSPREDTPGPAQGLAPGRSRRVLVRRRQELPIRRSQRACPWRAGLRTRLPRGRSSVRGAEPGRVVGKDNQAKGSGHERK